MRKFITVVPAVRTIPGVEQFDYAVAQDIAVSRGDVVYVPFRNKQIPGVIINKSDTSPFADKAIHVDAPKPLLRLGETFPLILQEAAQQSFSSKPSVLASWIRHVPKRAKYPTADDAPPTQTRLPTKSETRFLTDGWHAKNGLLAEARRATGHILVLTPWQHRAEAIAKSLASPALHSDLTPTKAWKAISDFTIQPSSILVATRIGAWLACVSDVVLIDEPENDDFKQDELSPRLDARRVVEFARSSRPDLSVIGFAITPRLMLPLHPDATTPNLEPELTREIWTKRGGTAVEHLSPQSINLIQAAIEENKTVTIIHPIRGDRARLACRDCGWSAVCAFCAFHLAHVGNTALCRRCGRRASLPDMCGNCGGTDLSRGQPGKDRLAIQCKTYFKSDAVRVVDQLGFDEMTARGETSDLVIITDLALLAPGVEDIRRKERLVISFRRIASAIPSNAHLHVQGSTELVDECAFWLSPEGVQAVWKTEYEERRAFGYPPAIRLAKLLVDGTANVAEELVRDVTAALPSGWTIRGPFPVTFRSYTRTPRSVIHVTLPAETTEPRMSAFFNTFKSRALIDLDPIAFFS